ncbi:MAG: hypothetical protein GXP62_09850 [Oligoflexia bacterium]|nr:hypothetical protein [Oligoflexia bacterium]
MGDKLQQTSTPSGPSTQTPPQQSTPQPDAQDQVGNAFIQQQTGPMTYDAALGDFLGPKLYDALSKQLTDAKLLGHAQSAVGSATTALNTYLQGNVEATDQQAAAAFVKALDAELKKGAAQFLKESDLGDALRGWVDEHPLSLATAAVAGAAAYILTNQDLPLIQTSKSLGGGHSVFGGVDPGRTLDLALEQVRVGYRYQSAGTKAELMGDYFGSDGGYQLTGSLQQDLGAYGAMNASGLHSERSGATKDRLDLGYHNDALAANAYYQRDRTAESDLTTLGGRLANVAAPDQLQAYVRGEARSDGSWEGAGGISKQVKDWGWGVEGYANQNAQGVNDSGVRAALHFNF